MDGVNLPQLVDQFRGVTAAEEQTVVAGLANVSVADQPDRCSRGVKGRKDERAPATHRCSAARVSGIGRSNAAEWGGSEPVVRRVAAQSLTCGPPRPSLRVPDFCCACEGARRMGGKRKFVSRRWQVGRVRRSRRLEGYVPGHPAALPNGGSEPGLLRIATSCARDSKGGRTLTDLQSR